MNDGCTICKEIGEADTCAVCGDEYLHKSVSSGRFQLYEMTADKMCMDVTEDGELNVYFHTEDSE